MLRVKPGEKRRVSLTVNGKALSGHSEPRMLLTDFLRHELGLYGTHVGCEHGVCGACTAIIDGVATRSCLRYAVQCDGIEIETVEGLSEDDGTLNILQKAFNENGALQCGFCTAGILMSATKFLEENSKPTNDEIRDMLSGHICRCTGYEQIVRAIRQASGQ
jgi:2-furoyl-CoA dehydrogenase 2Fe-2S iron sulfur subunit